MFWSSTCRLTPLALKFGGDLAEVERGARQPVKPGDDEHVAFADISQTRLERRPLVRGAAFFLLEDLVAVPELVELDVEALPDGADPGVPDERLMPL